MLVTWILATIVVGSLAFNYFEQISNWAVGVFNDLYPHAKKAWVYLSRKGNELIEKLRVLLGGRMEETSKTSPVKWEEVVQMYERGEIDADTFNKLKRENDNTKINEIER